MFKEYAVLFLIFKNKQSSLLRSCGVRAFGTHNSFATLTHAINTNASLIVSIRSLRSLILTASPNREEHAHAHVLLFEEQCAHTYAREATMSWPTNDSAMKNKRLTVANTCIRHVNTCACVALQCVYMYVSLKAESRKQQ